MVCCRIRSAAICRVVDVGVEQTVHHGQPLEHGVDSRDGDSAWTRLNNDPDGVEPGKLDVRGDNFKR